jgi:hypothetical protein
MPLVQSIYIKKLGMGEDKVCLLSQILNLGGGLVSRY